MSERLDEIKARLAKIPKKLILMDVRVPMKLRDPSDPRKIINDPRGRFQQTRMDIVDADDPHKIPLMHWHRYPDHPTYAGENWRDFAEMFLHAKEDLEYLIEKLEGEIKMTLSWENFSIKGTVATAGGDSISLESDKGSSDYSVLTVNGVQMKLVEQDLRDLLNLIQREAFPRLGVK